jgi:hypothetical protein
MRPQLGFTHEFSIALVALKFRLIVHMLFFLMSLQSRIGAVALRALFAGKRTLLHNISLRSVLDDNITV